MASYLFANRFRLLKYILLASDVAGILLSFNLAYWVRLGAFRPDGFFTLGFLWIIPVTVVLFYAFDLYNPAGQVRTLSLHNRSLLAVAALAALFLVSLFFVLPGPRDLMYGRGVVFIGFFIFLIWNYSFRYVVFRLAREQSNRVKWLAIGEWSLIAELLSDMKKHRTEWQVVFLTESKISTRSRESIAEYAGRFSQFERALGSDAFSGIIVAFRDEIPPAVLTSLLKSRIRGYRIYDLVSFYEHFWFKEPVHCIRSDWFVMAQGFDMLHNPIGARLKRVVDFAVGSAFLITLLPFLVLVALAISVDSPGGAFFSQNRIGLLGKPFRLYKFRTMYVRDKIGSPYTAADDKRITRIGKLLRRWRIDELPQMFNVLKGEMSFIGPRAEWDVLVERYRADIPYYDFRHMVKPGITGWAQVLFTYGSSVNDAREKLQYDLFYIRNQSLWLDFAILLKTVRIVVFGKGR